MDLPENPLHPAGASRRGLALLVDDEETVRHLLTDLLELQGWQVRSVGSAEAALEFVDEPGLALVVADLFLPGMDGRELMVRLRAAGLDVPVLFLSGDPRERAGLADPRSAFLAKPFRLDDLEAAVERLVAS